MGPPLFIGFFIQGVFTFHPFRKYELFRMGEIPGPDLRQPFPLGSDIQMLRVENSGCGS
ncbi:hypothetical protein D3OALGB2SA_4501 [Olavius algarvensis associated proteobacterium Delta 3]|nr:hypothetical protein D3OALGB2SA_4501 [Olavius algarvensis associated proteobacterium Delta 3]